MKNYFHQTFYNGHLNNDNSGKYKEIDKLQKITVDHVDSSKIFLILFMSYQGNHSKNMVAMATTFGIICYQRPRYEYVFFIFFIKFPCLPSLLFLG